MINGLYSLFTLLVYVVEYCSSVIIDFHHLSSAHNIQIQPNLNQTTKINPPSH